MNSHIINMIMEECLGKLAPRIAHFVETLTEDGKLGVTGSSARIADVNTGWVGYSAHLVCLPLDV